MGFDISVLANNKLLRDIAIVVDEDNSGTINNIKEGSIFLQKVKELQASGVIDENDEDYRKILDYCPQEITWSNGKKILTGKEEMPVDSSAKKAYDEQLNKDISFELNRLGLEKNEANIKKAMDLIKLKKDLEIQIKLSEAKIEKIKNNTVEKEYEKRELTTAMISMSGGTIACAAIGLKIGSVLSASTLNPVPMVAGAIIGGAVGAVLGCVGGILGHKYSINEENFEKNRQEQLAQEQQNLETLKAQLEKL